MLDEIGFMGNLTGLFHSGVDWRNDEQLRSCEYAFKNLTLHFIETSRPEILNQVRFDDTKVEMMLRRFYRDAFGVAHFNHTLKQICPDKEMRERILEEIERMSIRINSRNPRKTRVAAAFSLWMSTFRPIFIMGRPKQVWHLDASVNFYLATSYLELYGKIRVGVPGNDRTTRLQRILYDLTCRNINLSSLEMMYCSIFETDPAPAK
jgi:hypothetical protein